jgi:hypothetical protein
VHRIPDARLYHHLGGVRNWVMVQAVALIKEEGRRTRLAPSTVGCSLRSADDPPPAASRGR